jgi:hypothetical protein
MRTLHLVGALLLVAPNAARAQTSLGVRVGYASAQGDVGREVALDEWESGQIPIQAEVLVRVSRRAAVGAYASYGFGLASGDVKLLCELFGCSLSVVRAGVQAVYEFPAGAMVPWIGAGVGYEWSLANFAAGRAGPRSATLHGFEWLNLQGGADWRLARRLAVGPFLMGSIAQYRSGELATDAGSFSGTRSERAVHGWFQVGLRARFDL